MIRKRVLWIAGSITIALLLLFVLRFSILKGLGIFLIRDEVPQKVEYACVLSGGAYDRGLYAAQLYKQNMIQYIICTGGNPAFDLQAWGLPLLESDVTRHRLIALGVDSSNIVVLHQGTSTREESDIVLAYCNKQAIKECAIISSRFHTRRVKNVFKKKFEKAGVALHIYGAPSTVYKEDNWWVNEYGLLAVNNEYVKLIYYMLK